MVNLLSNRLVEKNRHQDACGVGMVASLTGKSSEQIVDSALQMSDCYKHRGAEDALGVGDGAGIITGMPVKFFKNLAASGKINDIAGQSVSVELEEGKFGVGQFFLSKDGGIREQQQQKIQEIIDKSKLQVAGWRKVEMDFSQVSEKTEEIMPNMQQAIFTLKSGESLDPDQFEKEIYRTRRKVEAAMIGFDIQDVMETAGIKIDGEKPEEARWVFDALDTLVSTLNDGDEHEISRVYGAISRNIAEDFDASTASKFEEAIKKEIDDYNFMKEANISSMSSRSIVYKATLTSDKVRNFFDDLKNIKYNGYEAPWAAVHSRFSTNTASSAHGAQPFSSLLHNGEINTIYGNMLEWSNHVAEHHGMQFPLRKGLSDSGRLNAVFEHLVYEQDMDPLKAMTMLIPPAMLETQKEDVKDMLKHISTIYSPFDGPANRVFTDGKTIGASLGRSGLRPGRYTLTEDKLIYGSEEGLVNWVENKDIVKRGSLRGGEMIAVDQTEKKFLSHDDILERLVDDFKKDYDYINLVNSAKVELEKTDVEVDYKHSMNTPTRQAAFGMSQEDLSEFINPMIQKGKVNVRAMGNDGPVPVLSNTPWRLTSYFNQRFAQVTNPPLDSIRERANMSLDVHLGINPVFHNKGEKAPAMIKLDSPVMREGDIERLRLTMQKQGMREERFDMTYDPSQKPDAMSEGAYLEQVIKKRAEEISKRIKEKGPAVIIMDDLNIDKGKAAIPALFAVAAMDHQLRDDKVRLKSSIVMDTQQVINDHDMAMMLGFGAQAVNTRMLHEIIHNRDVLNRLEDINGDKMSREKAMQNLHDAMDKGLLKIMAKMGINDVKSYIGARQFEAMGLDFDKKEQPFLANVFAGVFSPIRGHGRDEIAENAIEFASIAEEMERTGNLNLSHYGRVNVKSKDTAYVEPRIWGQESVDAFAELIGETARERLSEEIIPTYKDKLKEVERSLTPLKDKVEDADALKKVETYAKLTNQRTDAGNNLSISIINVIDENLDLKYTVTGDTEEIRKEQERIIGGIKSAKQNLKNLIAKEDNKKSPEKLNDAIRKWTENFVNKFAEIEDKTNLQGAFDERLDKAQVQIENIAQIEKDFWAAKNEANNAQGKLRGNEAKKALEEIYNSLKNIHKLQGNVTKLTELGLSENTDFIISEEARLHKELLRQAKEAKDVLIKNKFGSNKKFTDDEINFHEIKEGGAYRQFIKKIKNFRDENPILISDMVKLDYDKKADSYTLEEVETSISDIIKNMSTGGMSDGALSTPAHKAMARAMNRLGAKSNTGEGGEGAERHGTIENSSIKQFASGRFGAIAEYLAYADEVEIKVAQGAKPGEGGQLPAGKVSVTVAVKRNAIPGTELISPPPHHDIYSIEDLHELIYDLKSVNKIVIDKDGREQKKMLDVGVKLVSSEGIGTVAVGVAKALANAGINEEGKAGTINIVGNNGGTGASPITSVYNAGMPKEVGLAETNRALVEAGLRELVDLKTGGGMLSAEDIVKATILGADKVEFGTSAMIMLDCVMARLCGTNCPVGVATSIHKFAGDHRNLEQYMLNMATEVKEIVGKLGFKNIEEIRGNVELLEKINFGDKFRGKVDLEHILKQPDMEKAPKPLTMEEIMGLREQQVSEGVFRRKDDKVLEDGKVKDLLNNPQGKSSLSSGALANEDEQIIVDLGNLTNTDRGVGVRTAADLIRTRQGLSSAIKHDGYEDIEGSEGLKTPKFLKKLLNTKIGTIARNAIKILTGGTAGQSYAMAITEGMHMHHEGVLQDGAGKSMSGGILSVKTPSDMNENYKSHENVIAGNALLYGATGGEVYFNGQVGERFAVRGSGLTAVVEGMGDHGCEYMTMGCVLNLGKVGQNFGSGMSGGIMIQYVDPNNSDQNIDLEKKVDEEEIAVINASKHPYFKDSIEMMLKNHVKYTDSKIAASILENKVNMDNFRVAIPMALMAKTLKEDDGKKEINEKIALITEMKQAFSNQSDLNSGIIPWVIEADRNLRIAQNENQMDRR